MYKQRGQIRLSVWFFHSVLYKFVLAQVLLNIKLDGFWWWKLSNFTAIISHWASRVGGNLNLCLIINYRLSVLMLTCVAQGR